MTTHTVFYRNEDRNFYELIYRTSISGQIEPLALQIDYTTTQKILIEKPSTVKIIPEDEVGPILIYACIDSDGGIDYHGELDGVDSRLRTMLAGLKKTTKEDPEGRAEDILKMIRNRNSIIIENPKFKKPPSDDNE